MAMESGTRFGRLVALAFVERTPSRKARWLFRCDCGNETVAQVDNVRASAVQSCGCLGRESRVKHGMRGTREYRIWAGMLDRCRNPRRPEYSDYGGRGIRVCEQWHRFEAFFAGMGPPPSSKHEIDRIDNDGHYEPGNCRWATRSEQLRNMRSNVLVEFEGEPLVPEEYARRVGVSLGAAYARISRKTVTVIRPHA